MAMELQNLPSTASPMADQSNATDANATTLSKLDECKKQLFVGFHDFSAWSIPYMFDQVINRYHPTTARFYPSQPYSASSAKLDLRLDIVLSRLRDNEQGVIVVENGNIDSFTTLSMQYQVPLSFYNRHMGPFFSNQFAIAARKRSHDVHLDFRIYQGDFWEATGTEIFSNAIKYGFRISCRELRSGLYLVLVSAVSKPLTGETDELNARISPVGTPSISGIGVTIRSFFRNSAQGILEGLLGSFFRDGQGTSCLSLLQQNKYEDPSKILCWLLTLQAWALNLDIIGTDIRRHSYRASESPDEGNFYRLAGHRRTIAGLRNEMAGHRRQREVVLRPFDASVMSWRSQSQRSADSAETKTSTEWIQDIEDRVAELTSTMSEVSQFLTAWINLRDSETMKSQARRATELTALAVIYLPLTLVTSIFGMNLGEINGAVPTWWECLVALVLVGAVTSAPFGIWVYWRRRRESEAEGKRSQKAAGLDAS